MIKPTKLQELENAIKNLSILFLMVLLWVSSTKIQPPTTPCPNKIQKDSTLINRVSYLEMEFNKIKNDSIAEGDAIRNNRKDINKIKTHLELR